MRHRTIRRPTDPTRDHDRSLAPGYAEPILIRDPDRPGRYTEVWLGEPLRELDDREEDRPPRAAPFVDVV